MQRINNEEETLDQRSNQINEDKSVTNQNLNFQSYDMKEEKLSKNYSSQNCRISREFKKSDQIKWSSFYEGNKNRKSKKAIEVMIKEQNFSQKRLVHQQNLQNLQYLNQSQQIFQNPKAKQVETIQPNHLKNNRLDQPPFDFLFYNHDISNLSQIWISDKIQEVKQELKINTQFNTNLTQKEFENLSLSFVVDKISSMVQDKQQNSKSGKQIYDFLLQKRTLTWSKMFMKQPSIQKLLLNFFNQLEYIIHNEIEYNWEQMKLFFNCKQNKNSKSLDYKDIQNQKIKQAQQEIFDLIQNGAKEVLTTNDEKTNMKFIQEMAQLNVQLEKENTHPFLNEKTRDQISECLQFLNSIPDHFLKSYSPRMKPTLKELLPKQKELVKKFKEIIHNYKFDFSEKMKHIQDLYKEKCKEESEKRQAQLLYQGFDQISGKLNALQSSQFDLETELQIFDQQNQLHIIKTNKPVKKLTRELNNWEQELKKLENSSTDMADVCKKIWSIRENYEEEIRHEEKGWLIERKYMVQKIKNREKLMKMSYIFRIEALESALIEQKINYQKDICQLQMTIADLESKIQRMDVLEKYKQIDEYIQQQKTVLGELGLTFGDKNQEQAQAGTRIASTNLGSRKEKIIVSHINEYFTILREWQFTKANYMSQIEQHKKQYEFLMEQNNTIHQSQVLYHDAIFLILTNFTKLLKNSQIINTLQNEELNQSIIPSQFKISLTLEQINKFNELLKEYNFENKIESHHDKILQTEELVYNCFIELESMKNQMNKMINFRGPRESQNSPRDHRQHNFLQKSLINNELLFQYVDHVFNNFQEISKILNFKKIPQTILITETQITEEQQDEKIDQIEKKSNQERKASISIKKPLKEKLKKKKPEHEPTPNDHRPVQKKESTTGFNSWQALQQKMSRLGIISEQIETLVPSKSKKKLLYQYDQLCHQEIKKEENLIFFTKLTENPFTYFFIDKHAADNESSSDDSDQDRKEKKKNKEKIVMKKVKSYFVKKTLAHKEIEFLEFEQLIKNVNLRLGKLFKRIQKYQFKKKLSYLNIDESSANYGSQKIMPIDCIYIEQYGPPKINMIPLKILILQERSTEAYILLTQCLKIISEIYDIYYFKDILTKEEFQKIDMKFDRTNDKETQYDKTEENNNFVPFRNIKDQLLKVVENIRTFDGEDYFLNIFQNTLLSSQNESDFIKKLNQDILKEQNEKIEQLTYQFQRTLSTQKPQQLVFDDMQQSVSSVSSHKIQIMKDFSPEQKPAISENTQIIQSSPGKQQSKNSWNKLKDLIPRQLVKIKKQFKDNTTQTINLAVHSSSPIKLKREAQLLREAQQSLKIQVQDLDLVQAYTKKLNKEIQTSITSSYFVIVENQISELQNQLLKKQFDKHPNSAVSTLYNSQIEPIPRDQKKSITQITPRHLRVQKKYQKEQNIKPASPLTPRSLLKNQHIHNYILLGAFKPQYKSLLTQSINYQQLKYLGLMNNLNRKSNSLSEIQIQSKFIFPPKNSSVLQSFEKIQDSSQNRTNLFNFKFDQGQHSSINLHQNYLDNTLSQTQFHRPKTSQLRINFNNSQKNLGERRISLDSKTFQTQIIINNSQKTFAERKTSMDSSEFLIKTKDFRINERNKKHLEVTKDKKFIFKPIGLLNKSHENQLLLKYQKSFNNFKI